MCHRSKELSPTEERKNRHGICVTAFCMKKAAKGRLYCHGCARANWAERNPEKYLFANLRGNARRRGKQFTITFEEFKEFLVRENYMRRKRGRTKSSVSVDRERNELGYVSGNLQAITISANSEKRQYVDYYRRQYENAV